MLRAGVARMLPDLRMADVLRLRKAHPCGSFDWVVVRLGADIGLKCTGCGRRILLSRREVARRLKTTVRRGEEPAEDA
jgi:hypothetical protein